MKGLDPLHPDRFEAVDQTGEAAEADLERERVGEDGFATGLPNQSDDLRRLKVLTLGVKTFSSCKVTVETLLDRADYSIPDQKFRKVGAPDDRPDSNFLDVGKGGRDARFLHFVDDSSVSLGALFTHLDQSLLYLSVPIGESNSENVKLSRRKGGLKLHPPEEADPCRATGSQRFVETGNRIVVRERKRGKPRGDAEPNELRRA